MNLSWLRRQLANGVLPNECDESGADDVQLFQQSLHVVSRSHSLTVGQSAVIHESKLVEAPVTTTTLDPAGMTLNAEGDLSAFIISVILYGGALIGFVCVFSVVRRMFPMVYSNNVLQGWAPSPRPDDVGWVRASIGVKVADVAEIVGLDHALLLEFLHLGMKILLCYGTPMLLIMGPMNCFLGGNAAGEDHLSYLSFGNVEWDSWLYWIHAFCVWGVVFSVQFLTYKAQERFLEMRFEWLRAMADVRANTVLVEDIPPQHRSDEALRKYFNKLFGGKVKSAYCVKDVTTLAALEQQRQIARDALRLAEAKWQQAGGGEDARPTLKKSFMGERVDSIRYYTSLLEELKPQIKAEKRRITEEAAKGAGGVNLQNGFVTFTDRSTAEVALRLDLTPDQDALRLPDHCWPLFRLHAHCHWCDESRYHYQPGSFSAAVAVRRAHLRPLVHDFLLADVHHLDVQTFLHTESRSLVPAKAAKMVLLVPDRLRDLVGGYRPGHRKVYADAVHGPLRDHHGVRGDDAFCDTLFHELCSAPISQ